MMAGLQDIFHGISLSLGGGKGLCKYDVYYEELNPKQTMSKIRSENVERKGWRENSEIRLCKRDRRWNPLGGDCFGG